MSFFNALFGDTSQETVVTSLLDMVSNAANLASNPRDIDPLLDKMRATTSRLEPGAELSPADQKSLLEVYVALEEYLVTKDPIRTFTKDLLRQRLSPDLKDQLTAYENEGKGMV